jgi:hypothetical protein
MSRAPGAKTLAIRQALSDNPGKPLNEVSAMLKEQGFDASAAYISKVKSKMQGKRKKRKKAAPAPEAAPVLPKDAVSVGLLVKAKKLAAQFSSIKEAKEALAALSQLMD